MPLWLHSYVDLLECIFRYPDLLQTFVSKYNTGGNPPEVQQCYFHDICLFKSDEWLLGVRHNPSSSG